MSTPIVDLDYPFLKRQGILYIQQLAGKIWTDYGEHDAGITILENLCFAIIDLEYRTNFFIEDILASNPDSLEVQEVQQFYYAEEILPCNPLTINDFFKIIMDVPGVQSANILLSDGVQEIKGGYKIFIDIEERARRYHQEEKIKQEVWSRLYQHRNLCEDFFSVELMQLRSVRIKAAFAVSTCLSYEEGEMLLAKILFNIQSFLSPRINFYSLSQMIDKGKTVDQIFTGPLLNQGFIDEAELELTKRTQIYTADLLEQVTILPLIKNVLKFEVLLNEEMTSKRIASPIPPHCTFKLDIKLSDIALSYNGISIITDQEKVMHFFDEINRESLSNAYVSEESIFVPEGDFKELDYYASIQQDFPLIYNVGIEGFPRSAVIEHKAKVNQLKGFLMFFDQIFANYFALLDNIKNIMAVQGDTWDTLNGKCPKEVPYLERLIENAFSLSSKTDEDRIEFQVQQKYLDVVLNNTKKKHIPKNATERYITYLNKILATSQLNAKKRSDMLDHLLARFAEVFTTYSLALYEKKETERLKNSNRDKSFFLKDYVVISRDRNKGIDLTHSEEEKDSWNGSSISGFERRIYLKLGIKQLSRRFLHETLKEHVYLEKNIIQNSFEIFLGKSVQREDDDILIFQGKFPKIKPLAIKYGIHEDNYDIIGTPDGHYKIILYVDKARKHAIHIVKNRQPFVHVEQTEHIIRQSVHFFNTLNIQSEGFHCVEHILLRHDTSFQGSNDPYSFIMTMVFPSWPSRFQENSFRNLVQELIISESPAHIYVNILWLDIEEMEGFEKAYKNWMLLRTAQKINQDKLNQSAKALLGLIMLYSRD